MPVIKNIGKGKNNSHIFTNKTVHILKHEFERVLDFITNKENCTIVSKNTTIWNTE